jgi:hypothetical protein
MFDPGPVGLDRLGPSSRPASLSGLPRSPNGLGYGLLVDSDRDSRFRSWQSMDVYNYQATPLLFTAPQRAISQTIRRQRNENSKLRGSRYARYVDSSDIRARTDMPQAMRAEIRGRDHKLDRYWKYRYNRIQGQKAGSQALHVHEELRSPECQTPQATGSNTTRVTPLRSTLFNVFSRNTPQGQY